MEIKIEGMSLLALRTAVATKGYIPARESILELIDRVVHQMPKRHSAYWLVVGAMAIGVSEIALALWIARLAGWL